MGPEKKTPKGGGDAVAGPYPWTTGADGSPFTSSDGSNRCAASASGKTTRILTRAMRRCGQW